MMVAPIKTVVNRVITGMDSGCTLKIEPRIGIWSVREREESGKTPLFWFEKVKSGKIVADHVWGTRKIRN